MKTKHPATIFLLLCIAGYVENLQAQTFYNRGSKITVKPNTVLSVKGGVENNGTFTNNGHLKVAGPWVNSGTYHAGVGEITFNSTSRTLPQIIHHNGQAISEITITGGSKKVILSDLTIDKGINLQDGVVEASGNSKIIFKPEAIISGASDNSHIHGPVHHSGKGQKLFPIGNGLIYLPVELVYVEDPAAVIGVRAFEFDNLSLSKPASLDAISEKRYWHIDVVSGGLHNSQVVLPLRDEPLLRDPENVVVVQSPAPTKDFTSIGRSFFEGETTNGRVTSDLKVTMPFVALATSAADPEVIVYNAVSANGDGLNDFLMIENIGNYPVNKFSLFSRWGDKIFELDNYDNEDRVFQGRSNLHGDGELVSGTYFYVLEMDGRPSLKGFLTLKN